MSGTSVVVDNGTKFSITDIGNPRAGLSEKMEFDDFLVKAVAQAKVSAWARWRRAFLLLYFEEVYEGTDEKGAYYGDAITFGEKVWGVSEKSLRRDMNMATRFKNTLNINVPFNMHELISIDDEFWHRYILPRIEQKLGERDTTVEEIRRQLVSTVSLIKTLLRDGYSNEEIVGIIENGISIVDNGDGDDGDSSQEAELSVVAEDEGDVIEVHDIDAVLNRVKKEIASAVATLDAAPSELEISIIIKRKGIA